MEDTELIEDQFNALNDGKLQIKTSFIKDEGELLHNDNKIIDMIETDEKNAMDENVTSDTLKIEDHREGDNFHEERTNDGDTVGKRSGKQSTEEEIIQTFEGEVKDDHNTDKETANIGSEKNAVIPENCNSNDNSLVISNTDVVHSELEACPNEGGVVESEMNEVRAFEKNKAGDLIIEVEDKECEQVEEVDDQSHQGFEEDHESSVKIREGTRGDKQRDEDEEDGLNDQPDLPSKPEMLSRTESLTTENKYTEGDDDKKQEVKSLRLLDQTSEDEGDKSSETEKSDDDNEKNVRNRSEEIHQENTPADMTQLPRSSSVIEGHRATTLTHKILLVGSTGVGKTCILKRFVDGVFPHKSKATLGLDFRIKSVTTDQKVVKLQLWDTSGQERFRSMTQAYYRGASGVLLVFDLTKENSLLTLPEWLGDIKQYAPEDAEVILVGNKVDLEESRSVSREAGEEFAREHGVAYFETSAVDDVNINDAFKKMAHLVVSRERKRRATTIGLVKQLSGEVDQVDEKREKTWKCAC